MTNAIKERIKVIIYKNSHDDSECIRIRFDKIDDVIDQIYNAFIGETKN